MKDEARCAKAKSEAAIGEASHRKAASALNGVIEVQDRLVRALRTEADLIKRAKEVAQVRSPQVEYFVLFVSMPRKTATDMCVSVCV